MQTLHPNIRPRYNNFNKINENFEHLKAALENNFVRLPPRLMESDEELEEEQEREQPREDHQIIEQQQIMNAEINLLEQQMAPILVHQPEPIIQEEAAGIEEIERQLLQIATYDPPLPIINIIRVER